MENNRIEELYEILIRGLQLTKEILTIYKFSDEEVSDLVNQGILKEIEPNKYTLSSVDNMYHYGIRLQLKRKNQKAEDCFRRCYRIDPNNRKVCLQLLLHDLKAHNYIAVEKTFKLVEQINPKEHIEDNKLYLYLLGIILFNNKEYQERLKNMEPEEILIPWHKEYANKDKQNEIRSTIIKKKYPYAAKLLNDLMRKNIAYTIEDELLKELISQALLLDKKFKLSIKLATKNNEYKRIIELLEKKSKNQYLSNMETYIQLVAKAIIEVSETETIPTITTYSTNYLYEALKGNNFKLARELNIKFLNETEQLVEEDVLNILLNDLVKRIEIIEEKELTQVLNETEIHPIEETIQIEKDPIYSELDLSDEEELASYIKNSNMSLETAKKNLGLLSEQLLLIKLIYIRNYYLEGTELSINLADKLLKTVEYSHPKTGKVIQFIEEIKQNKESYIQNKGTYTRKKTK